MGVELQASEGSHTRGDMKVLYVTLLLGALVATAECKRRGGGGKPKKARSARGGERSWHIAGEGGEESCGNSTEIFTTETPSSRCNEVGNNFCICTTRGDLEQEDEEAVKKRKQEKKKISAEAKARKKEMRRKMRQKLKGRQEKMKRRKQSHRASMAEEAEE